MRTASVKRMFISSYPGTSDDNVVCEFIASQGNEEHYKVTDYPVINGSVHQRITTIIITAETSIKQLENC